MKTSIFLTQPIFLSYKVTPSSFFCTKISRVKELRIHNQNAAVQENAKSKLPTSDVTVNIQEKRLAENCRKKALSRSTQGSQPF